ncbi:AraC family transcriptional regulator [Pseudoalteromonas piscicida]|uniref:AraC family transcriptional regulator n=2 Tax=Pseudoalteromonas TaxID=53246 RepID=A0AAQ2ESN9_PSEO7|nr:AraC family transcriptional regulator [Pseudoalteromonas sp. A22]KJY87736.1 AraC family transcriptional regulator [Pseudoalteromonas piscicida]TMN78182.1 AraC family transcriptional regulator [Pseudoalteromonas flavipulchra]QUI61333.1 helix-turn-helix domain-containing protein [Pseudoalteromonas sp. A22]TMN35294.1 AraC family transcriptional regulator [Pseudoalteromonas piscicida]TMN39145.1 AraC family transcriptional regulator [Pseudoalteromonas piscicida]
MTRKATTLSHYTTRLNTVIDYIYNNINRELDVITLADQCHMSTYHFHRVYRSIAGETINATVRRMRLHVAAGMLIRTQDSIAKVAEQTGYASIEAFSRAFSQRYKQPPSLFRQHEQAKAKGCAAEFYIIKVDEDSNMFNVEIGSNEQMMLIGLEHHGDYMQIGQAFEKLNVLAQQQGLLGEDTRFFGVYFDDPKTVEESKLKSIATILVPKTTASLPEGFCEFAIPPGKTASLLYQGDYASLETPYEYLFGQWLPNSEFEPADVPVIEEYLNDVRDTPPHELLTRITCYIK